MNEHKCDTFCLEYGCEQMKEKFCDQKPPCGNPIGKHKHVTAKVIGEKEMSTFGAGANKEQPMPKKNNNPAIWDLVISEMKARDKVGQERYHTRLQANNGRDALRDALDEALDLCVYLRQAIYERDGK